MFDALSKSKFHCKCKSDLKMVRTRIDMIKRKRNATQKYLRNDVADLLKNGLDFDAYARAEGLTTEMNRSQCYELIDQYCDYISNHLSALDKQRECLEECREAASGLMFAAARFADLPELRELRSIFSERYGNSLDYYVNKQFKEKVKPGHPSSEIKLQLLQDIAAESGLEWSSKALENKLFRDPAYYKNVAKETNDSEHSLDDHKDGLVQKHARAGSGYEFYPVQELNPKPEKGNEQKEATRNENGSPPVKDIQVDKIIKPQEDDHVLEAKQKVKSVRTKSLKPSRGEDSGGGSAGMNKEKAALGQRVLVFLDAGVRDHRDEEEKKMDKLLKHYSRKKGSRLESGVKPTHQRSSTDPNMAMRDGPSRLVSMPNGPRAPVENPKTHSRAASFQPDTHVHPNMPDYDDFVARLAAFRGK